MYADTLTRLFEDSARVVESVLPMVEVCYGDDNVSKILASIQDECVRQARGTFNNFLQTRNVIDIVTAINGNEQVINTVMIAY